MEPFTLNRYYGKETVIDGFNSIIWTERYYGDGQVEMVVPANQEMIAKLPLGVFLGIAESDEIMIVETADFQDDNTLKIAGISLLKWMNNRFIRASASHLDRYWYLENMKPGQILWWIIYIMCVHPGGQNEPDMGIPNQAELAIPITLKSYDTSDSEINIGIPYGPVYDAMRDLATTYQLGIRIVLEENALKFECYKGADRTSNQTRNQNNQITNPVVQFSPYMDSLTDIKELQSIATFKTLAYAFAPGLTDLTPSRAGVSRLSSRGGQNSQYTGFDLRALMILAEDITTDMVEGDAAKIPPILDTRAQDGLAKNPSIQVVDGEIVPTSQFTYGVDYFLGDLIEMQGTSGATQVARVTEYIRAQDSSGEKAYPTVTRSD